MQSNVVVMPNRAPNPDSVPALRHDIREVSEGLSKLRVDFNAANEPPSWRKRLDKLSKVESALVAALILGFCSLIWWATRNLTNSYIDVRSAAIIQPVIQPLVKQVTDIDGRTTRMEGMLSVLQAQIAAQRLSGTPPKELKNNLEELKNIKSNLAKTTPNAPGFWPASFQTIALLSKSLSGVEANNKPEVTLDGVSGYTPQTIKFPTGAGARFVLKNTISNSVFQDAVVRFDPSVQLENVTFINCILILPIQVNPPQNIQKIGKSLLASDLSKVTINGS